MKKSITTQLIAAAILTVFPCIPAYLIPPVCAGKGEQEITFTEFREPETSVRETYRVLHTETGDVEEVPVREYLIGSLCAEMPISFEMEALKAQVVAAHTYAERQAALADLRQEEELKGADFSDDAAVYQAFYTNAELRELFGDEFEERYSRAAEAVDAVCSEILTYEEEPILAAFHAISSGKTESAENVWGADVEYLRCVESPEDTQAPEFEGKAEFPASEVRKRLEEARGELILPETVEKWFGEPVYSDAGTVLQIRIGNSYFTGQELRGIFNLRSAAFSVESDGDTIRFLTKGYGHDVGMSQYGANTMAKNGNTYQQILKYYYPGTTLCGEPPQVSCGVPPQAS